MTTFSVESSATTATVGSGPSSVEVTALISAADEGITTSTAGAEVGATSPSSSPEPRVEVETEASTATTDEGVATYSGAADVADGRYMVL